ncbi:plasmanylethanolamine desaturase 1 isoform X2 [Bactrocera oleae]
MPLKSDQEIMENSMLEEDPNGNSALEQVFNTEKNSPRWGPQHKGAQELAKLYGPGKRLQEIVCVYTCIALMLVDLILILKHIHFERLSVACVSALCGIITADFGSGLVHWAADTWGSVELPVIGKNFLRPFREHHLDPTSITRHDFIETNGDNFMVSIPILGFLAYSFNTKSPQDIQQDFGWISYLFLCSIFVAMTNQANNTLKILAKIPHTGTGLDKMVDKFLMKNIRKKPMLTAYGFFQLDRSALFKVLAIFEIDYILCINLTLFLIPQLFTAIITYIMILVQFTDIENSLKSKN